MFSLKMHNLIQQTEENMARTFLVVSAYFHAFDMCNFRLTKCCFCIPVVLSVANVVTGINLAWAAAVLVAQSVVLSMHSEGRF